MIDDGYVGI